MVPIYQQCHKCGNMFWGSDHIGEACPNCYFTDENFEILTLKEINKKFDIDAAVDFILDERFGGP